MIMRGVSSPYTRWCIPQWENHLSSLTGHLATCGYMMRLFTKMTLQDGSESAWLENSRRSIGSRSDKSSSRSGFVCDVERLGENCHRLRWAAISCWPSLPSVVAARSARCLPRSRTVVGLRLFAVVHDDEQLPRHVTQRRRSAFLAPGCPSCLSSL